MFPGMSDARRYRVLLRNERPSCGTNVTKKKRMRVLVADDNPTMRRIIRSFLDELPDVEVCAEVSDGVAAVDAAREQKPDLVILDVVMPGLSGVEAAALIKKFLPRAKAILFTTYGDAVGKTLANSVGVDIVIPKIEGGLAALSEKISAVIAKEN